MGEAYYPTHYIPAGDVRAGLAPTGEIVHSPSRGDATVSDVVTAGGKAARPAGRYHDSLLEQLRDSVHASKPAA